MTVEFTPKNEQCFCFGAPNSHVFELLKVKKIAEILNHPPLTNDPIDANEEQSKAIAYFMENWDHGDWPGDKPTYIQFFLECGGFQTH